MRTLRVLEITAKCYSRMRKKIDCDPSVLSDSQDARFSPAVTSPRAFFTNCGCLCTQQFFFCFRFRQKQQTMCSAEECIKRASLFFVWNDRYVGFRKMCIYNQWKALLITVPGTNRFLRRHNGRVVPYRSAFSIGIWRRSLSAGTGTMILTSRWQGQYNQWKRNRTKKWAC